MTTFVIKNVPLNRSLTQESDAETWSELLDEIQETHGTDIARPGMKAILRSNRQQLNPDSSLPDEEKVEINLFSTKLDAGIAAVGNEGCE